VNSYVACRAVRQSVPWMTERDLADNVSVPLTRFEDYFIRWPLTRSAVYYNSSLVAGAARHTRRQAKLFGKKCSEMLLAEH